MNGSTDQRSSSGKTKTRIVAILLIVAVILLLIWIILGYCISCAGGSSVKDGEKLVLVKNDFETMYGFYVENMFPGDTENASYRVQIKDSGIKKINFRIEITEKNCPLDEALYMTVRFGDGDEIIYEGFLKDMPDSISVDLPKGKNMIDYNFTASLGTDAGNEYANGKLTADFIWWSNEEHYESTGISGYIKGEKCVLWCLNICPWCWIIPFIIVVVIISLTVVLIVMKRSKKDEKNKNES